MGFSKTLRVFKKIGKIGFALGLVCLLAHCAKPLLYGKVQKVAAVRESFAYSYDEVYAATLWALEQEGYSIEESSKERGTIITDWTPSTPDSHYVEVFGRRDYGTTASYYHLDIALYQDDQKKIQVVVRSVAKSVVTRLFSTQIEEHHVIDRIQNYLRGRDIDLTNLGTSKP